MARRCGDHVRPLVICIVGVSGGEKEKGVTGVGKSCLCNRFIRPQADNYHVDHISVLSQTDFSGRVVNNDHFLYWGDSSRSSEEGVDYCFHVIEQTEFIDDASFMPFKAGKMDPYMKRCCSSKIQSAEKLMYICKNQLGIEKEYEQKTLPDGKLNVDGFLCIFDVSQVPNRCLDRMVEQTASILMNCVKTKRPVVLVTTKNDEASELYVKEAEKLCCRKEYKGNIPLVETSSHENVNIDLAFLTLAQLVDRNRGKIRIVPFYEAARQRKEILDISTDAYLRLIRALVTDYRTVWSHTVKKLAQHNDFMYYVDIFGIDYAARLFRRHTKKLKDDFLQRKIDAYMDILPSILRDFFPNLPSLQDGDWLTIQQRIAELAEFDRYFLRSDEDLPWSENPDLLESTDHRIPFDVLDSNEAETVYRNHVNALQAELEMREMPKRMRDRFKKLLADTGYVTPGKRLDEVRVLFMGRESFDNLSEHDRQIIYDHHQKEITEKARKNFTELLIEHAELFNHVKNVVPSGTITQEDIREITIALQEDSRYKYMDRLENERTLLLLQHLGFVHCPKKEHCPANKKCTDQIIQTIISQTEKSSRPGSGSWSGHGIEYPPNCNENAREKFPLKESNVDSKSDYVSREYGANGSLGSGSRLVVDQHINLVVFGKDKIASELHDRIKTLCEDDEYEVDNRVFSLDYKTIGGDLSLPQNSFKSTEFKANGIVCAYSTESDFEYIQEGLAKSFVGHEDKEEDQQQIPPIAILFTPHTSLEQKIAHKLHHDGEALAESLQCTFVDAETSISATDEEHFDISSLSSAMRSLVINIEHQNKTVPHSIFSGSSASLTKDIQPDIRIIMCLLCGDSYNVENVLSPLLANQMSVVTSERSISIQTFLDDCKRRVEVIVSSYHGASAFREDLVHGFILVYSTKRKASLATLKAFSANIPNLPIQILAVTDSGSASAFFSSDMSQQLITEGNNIADRLQAHFMTSTATYQPKSAFFTPFFKEVWDKKNEIEQAFHMEDPSGLDDSGGGTLERPLISSTRVGDHRVGFRPVRRTAPQRSRSAEGSSSEIYEAVPTDGSLGDDLDDALSFPDQRLTPSDDSDIYSHIDNDEEEHLVKPSMLKKQQRANRGWVDDSMVPVHQDYWPDSNYGGHLFSTGRRGKAQPPPIKPKPKTSQTLKTFQTLTEAVNQVTSKQPGKLNLRAYSNVTDAIGKINIKDGCPLTSAKLTKAGEVHAPLATPEMDPGSDYTTVKDVVPGMYFEGGEYNYSRVPEISQAASAKARQRQRREKGRQGVGVDGDSTFYRILPEEESSLDVSSPRDPHSPSLPGGQLKKDLDKTGKRKQKQRNKEEAAKIKEDEKRRLKEEEKLKKEKEREKKKALKSNTKSGNSKVPSLEDFLQPGGQMVPLLVEKCITFIEEEGLDSEGIYRVPGNKIHVEQLFLKFKEDSDIDWAAMDIPVNAAATALKDYLKQLPPLLPADKMDDLTHISEIGDRSCRLLKLKEVLTSLPKVNFEVIKYIFQHFVRVAENSKLNSMDSKNLAICWWPTLFHILQFNDISEFESRRPHIEDIVQTMIDQFPFLFQGKEDYVMV